MVIAQVGEVWLCGRHAGRRATALTGRTVGQGSDEWLPAKPRLTVTPQKHQGTGRIVVVSLLLRQ